MPAYWNWEWLQQRKRKLRLRYADQIKTDVFRLSAPQMRWMFVGESASKMSDGLRRLESRCDDWDRSKAQDLLFEVEVTMMTVSFEGEYVCLAIEGLENTAEGRGFLYDAVIDPRYVQDLRTEDPERLVRYARELIDAGGKLVGRIESFYSEQGRMFDDLATPTLGRYFDADRQIRTARDLFLLGYPDVAFFTLVRLLEQVTGGLLTLYQPDFATPPSKQDRSSLNNQLEFLTKTPLQTTGEPLFHAPVGIVASSLRQFRNKVTHELETTSSEFGNAVISPFAQLAIEVLRESEALYAQRESPSTE